VLVLCERDVDAVLDMDAALDAVRRAQSAAYAGDAQVLAKSRARAGDLALHAVGGALGQDGIGSAEVIKIAGVKAYVSGAARAHWVLLFDNRHGLRAVVAADRLGRLRTGAASGMAVDALARPDAAALCLIGAGRQAFTQVEAISRVRKLSTVTVASRTESRARAMAGQIESRLGLTARATKDPAAAVAAADIVVTITTAREPVLAGARLVPGTHVVLAGSSHASRREADAAVFARAALVVVDDLDLARAHSGDLIAAVAEGALDWSDVRAAGWALDPANQPCADRDDITVFCSHGIGIWDVALAATAVDRAEAAGLGVRVPA
jgi:alanine dehydrogenase